MRSGEGRPRAPGRAGLEAVLFDSAGLRTISTAAVIIFVITQIRPLGIHGAGPWIIALIVVNVVLMAGRMLPEHRRDRLPRLPLDCAAVLAGAALLALDRTGSSSAFPFYLAGQLGYRRPQRESIAFAVAISATSLLAILIGHTAAGYGTPWWLGVLTGTPVLLGMTNRARDVALDAERRAAEQSRQAAVSQAQVQTLAERGRIARDVHDVLAHSLAAVNMQLEAVDALLDADRPEEAQVAARRAQSLVREGLAEVSRTVRALREDALPLVETLGTMVGNSAPDGTRLEVLGSEVDLPTPKTTTLTRCAQEALTNAHKYAPGARVRVCLRFDADTVELDVGNGRAAPDAPAPLAGSGSGMGLVGMRERVASVGGSVQAGPVVDGADAGGWLVRVVIPA